MKNRILVIDDQELMRESLCETLSRAGYEVDAAGDGSEGIERFEGERFAAVITDLKMPDVGGMTVLSRVQEIGPETPVIVITGHGSIENAVEAMKKGAFDYITKPFEPGEIEVLVQKAVKHYSLVVENASLRAQIDERERTREMINLSRSMRAMEGQILKLAKTPATVLIHGESGVGKEVVARAIHYSGPRADKAFLCVNCAALSAGVLESELFGHEKGAFTGADRQRQGRFELADGGTIMLDEISEIDPGLQAKLLRVLQERCFERVGSSVSRRVDVRVLATTNRDLQACVREGTFREDLYYRLNVVPLHVPPLRERPDEVRTLAQYFLKRFAAREGRRPRELSPEAISLLEQYSWPGNVRELENLIERACILDLGEVINAEQLRPWLDGTTNLGIDQIEVGMPLEEVERILISKALERFDGHRARTAKALGIGVRTLTMKIKKWGLVTRRNCRVSADSDDENAA
ncbi:MAG TPA: sigma-54 dependent transcriptional regulator [Planctomycetota bacterium]|nr:sigma-54 dependent transcriptional regulator [Planctomycetota bacterium]